MYTHTHKHIWIFSFYCKKYRFFPSLCMGNIQLPMALFWFSSKGGGKDNAIISLVNCSELCEAKTHHTRVGMGNGAGSWPVWIPLQGIRLTLMGLILQPVHPLSANSQSEQPENEISACSCQDNCNNWGLLLSVPPQNGGRRGLEQENGSSRVFRYTWCQWAENVLCLVLW